MRVVKLSKQGSIKASSGEKLLYRKDFEDFSKSHLPGEWVLFEGRDSFLGYVNPLVVKGAVGRIVHAVMKNEYLEKSESDVALSTIKTMINKSVEYRSLFSNIETGSRLIYGDEDNLPGLIVDRYKNCTIVQINTAGLDRFRNDVRDILSDEFNNVIFMDDKKYRSNELLPIHEDVDENPTDVEVVENDLTYKLPWEIIQKIGYYYDHRENRKKLESSLKKINIKIEKGLDLFSYVGSWGLHALKAGAGYIDFVDQAKMEEVTVSNLELNNFSGKGKFHHSDVFNFLTESEKESYDLIISDPPAFAKDEKGKKQALRGYDKLHGKIFPLLRNKSIFVAASCTHYVSLNELDSSVSNAAKRNGRKLKVLDIGVQGPDHPFSNLNSKSNYIKYILYYVENGVQDERTTT